MEKNTFRTLESQLPDPTRMPVPEDRLGSLLIDPTIQLNSPVTQTPELVHLTGPDGYQFSVKINSQTKKVTNEQAASLTETRELSDSLYSDVGKIDIAPIGDIVDSLRVSFHGVKYSIAKVREDRAKTRIDKMNRKDALYSDLAIGLVTPSGTTERPQTYVDRHMDKRLEEKAWKHELKKAEQKRIRKINSVNGENSNTSSAVGIRMKANTHKRLAQVNREYRAGNITATEKRTATINVRSTPKNFENQPQRQSRRAVTGRTVGGKRVVAGSEGRLERAKKQPIASRWRAFRRLNAQDSIVEHQQRAQKHLDKAIDIENNRP